MLSINIDGLEKDFIPAIETGLKKLNIAQVKLSTFIIPDDFCYKKTLQNMNLSLLEKYDIIKEIKSWVEEKIESMNSLDASNRALANAMGNIAICEGDTISFANNKTNQSKDAGSLFGDRSTLESGMFKTAEQITITKDETSKAKEGKSLGDKITNKIFKFSNYIFSKDFLTDAGNVAKKTGTMVVDGAQKTGSMVVKGAKKLSSPTDMLGYIQEGVAYFVGGDILLDAADIAKKTKSQVTSAADKYLPKVFNVAGKTASYVGNKTESILNLLIGEEKTEFIKNALNKVTDTGSQAVATCNNVFNKYIDPLLDKAKEKADPYLDFAGEVFASYTNIQLGAMKGVGKVAEGLTDGLVLLSTGVASAFTGLYDLGQYIFLEEGEWSSVTKGTWNSTMGVVTEDIVGNIHSLFYRENIIGKALDENAHEYAKSDGILVEVAAAVGETAGNIALTITTGGTYSTVLIATSAFGRYTEESWAKMRNSSIEGIEEMYKRGQMSKEEYDSIMGIKNLTKEQWSELEAKYKAGKIPEKDFQTMQDIRKMTQKWKTSGNLLKGLGYGAVNAVWESVQWDIGKYLNRVGASALKNIGIDTLFNSADTFFRTGTEAIFGDSTIKQAWEEQGGWTSVLIDTGIGLVFSAGGEAIGTLEFNKTQIDDKYFKSIVSNDGYGVDQGILYNFYYYEAPDGTLIKSTDIQTLRNFWDAGIKLERTVSPEYDRIKCIIMNKYEMSAKDAEKFIAGLDSVGACSYADVANNIVATYKNKPEEFEKIFGFSLYKNLQNGEVALNSDELLVDMYYYINHADNGGRLFAKSTEIEGDNVVITDWDNYGTTADYFLDKPTFNNQEYLSSSEGFNEYNINKYLQSKNVNLSVNSTVVHDVKYCGETSKQFYDTSEIVKEGLKNGQQYSMGIYSGNGEIRFIDMETNKVYCTTNNWNEGGGHAVKVTGMNKQGYIVSTWGKRCLIPYEDLMKSGLYNIINFSITGG